MLSGCVVRRLTVGAGGLCAVAALGHGQDVLQPPSTTWCHFYNETVCPDGADSCREKEDCRDPLQPERRKMCFVLWKNTTAETIEVLLKVRGKYTCGA